MCGCGEASCIQENPVAECFRQMSDQHALQHAVLEMKSSKSPEAMAKAGGNRIPSVPGHREIAGVEFREI